MKPMLIAACALVLVAAAAGAQTVDQYEIRIYASDASLAFSTKTSATCNLAAVTPPSTPPVNPTYLYWNDPVNAGKLCRVTMTNILSALKLAGTYTARVIAISVGFSSPESAATTFEKAGPPPAPTGVFAQ